MIIVKVIGGLGNQMFQYAFGKYLSIKNNLCLKLDIFGFEQYKLHNYGLNHLNIKENLISREEVKEIQKRGRICRKIIGIVEKKVRYNCLLDFFKNLCSGYLFLNEKGSSFNKNIYNLKVKSDIYLNGYWASEKYFKDIKDIILKEFTMKYSTDEQNQIMINKILDCESVSLHIRWGDYVNSPITNKLFGTCSMEYYNSVIVKIKEKITNPHLFIFSDDPERTQKNMRLSFPTTFVNINKADKDYEDLRLMSLCKHNIIADSTFSWWGAWF